MAKRANGPQRSGSPPALGRRRLLRLVGATALAPLLTGCQAPTFFQKASEDRVTVAMTPDRRYAPATVTIPLGATVVWHNESSLPHTATSDPLAAQDPALAQLPEGAPAWRSGDVYPGETWALTFQVAGTYVYSCRFHGEQGMVGTITVTD